MVTPAMQQQPQVIYGPNGERAEWNGREYVVAPQAAAPASGGYQLQPMVTPAEQRAREEREYDRERDVVRDQLTASREERAIDAARRSADTAERAAAKLTEDQGKAGGYAQLMADAEQSYQQALQEGFNPTGIRAGVANFTDNIPLMSGVGNFIRDDAGDRARQAELQWSDAQLKAMSGAASPEPEVVRNNITFFARPGQNYGYLGERLEEARQVAFEASKRRAGPDLQGLAYPETDPVAGASPEAPFNFVGASREDTIAAIKRGGWFINGDGEPYQLPPSDPNFGPEQPGDQRVSQGVVVRPQEVRQDAAAARTEQGEGLGRKIDAGVRGIADTLTFGLADEIAAGANTILPLDRGSQSLWTEGAGDAYAHNLAMQRGIDQADARDVPVSRGAGQVAGGVAGIGGVARGGAMAARLASRPIARNALAGAGYGAAYGFGSDEGNALQRADGAAIGAGTGAVAGVVAAPVANALAGGVRALARRPVNALGDRAPAAVREFVRPPPPSPRSLDVQNLRASGVSLTPGQRMGGMAQSVENLAQRAPILGPAIRGARQRGNESLNRAVGLRAMENIGEGIPTNVEPGGDLVGYVGKRLGGEFDRAAGLVEQVAPDEPLTAGLAAISQRKSDLPPAIGEQFDRIVGERLGRFQGPITGQQLRQIETELSGLGAQYSSATDPAQRQLGSMIEDVAGELRATLGRANPEAGQILNSASAGWADFTRMRRASASAGGRPFTPGQLSTAVRTEDGSVAKGAVARGEARMQDLSRAAQNIMPDSFGNPGTADAVGLGGIGVGMVTEPVTTTGIVAGLGAASLPYLAMGRKVIERLPAGMQRTMNAIPEAEIEALMRAASDPARLAETVELLAARTSNRREARNLARTLRHQAIRVTTGRQSGQQE